MLFSDVIGQQMVKQHLVEMLQHNRLSHALLFLGKEGSGSLPLALAFAQYITCEKVQNKGAVAATSSMFGFEEAPVSASTVQPLPMDSCGVCPSCLKAKQYAHPDIHYSYPVIPKKSGDKPVSTDYIKEWREFLQVYPYGNVYDWLQNIGAENKQGNIT